MDQPNPLTPGTVHLIGAGPGRKDWLTVEAKQVLRKADLLAYDDLIHPELFEFAGAQTKLLSVGYRAHKEKKTDLIHPMIIDYAKRGMTVVRLKSGDPMLYGRAWEEIAVLDQHGINWNIVPGISVLFGAAAAVPLPLTHRGLSAGLKIIAGNHSHPSHDSRETIAVYMPRNKISQLCERLVAEGRPSEQAAVYIQAVGSPLQEQHYGTLASLPEIVAQKAKDLPGIVIIGDVVPLAHQQNSGWKKPLSHCRILLLRLSDIESPLIETFKRWGADCIPYPYLQRELCYSHTQIVGTLEKIAADETLICSSSFTVECIQKALIACRFDPRRLPEFAVMTIGDRCRKAVERLGWPIQHHFREIPKQDDLLSLCHSFSTSKVFHYLGENVTAQRLQAAWPFPSRFIQHHLYALTYQSLRINAPEPHLIIAPNQKSAQVFFEIENELESEKLQFAVLGEKTKKFLQDQGVTRIICPKTASYTSLLKQIKNWADHHSFPLISRETYERKLV
ncbi:MAG: uroporphyrinogen-III C-methyltransferase [Oligoflexus sp.]